MTDPDMEVIKLPTSYSPDDAECIRAITARIMAAKNAYMQEVTPLFEELARIETRYSPRIVLAPRALRDAAKG